MSTDSSSASVPPEPAANQFASIKLTMTEPDQEPREFKFSQARITFGREPSCDVVMNDEESSRQQCLIEFDEAGQPYLSDLLSTNGTWLGDERVEREPLNDGATFRVGKTHIRAELTSI